MKTLPLFVFGTLRRGQCNHHFLAGGYERVLPARLPGFERVAPLMIARKAGAAVDGELFFLRPETYGDVMRRCDWLEGIEPGESAGPEYRRLMVTVETDEGTISAWAYVHPETTDP